MAMPTFIFAIFFVSAELVSIDTKDMDLSDFFRLMANVGNVNVVLHPAVQGKVNLVVKDVPWEQVLNLVLKSHGLLKEVEGNIMRIAPASTFETEQKQKAATREACLNTLPLQTHVYVLSYARAENIGAIISKMVSSRGSVIAYPMRNALIVTDIERTAECPH